jgi:hypothetical protein
MADGDDDVTRATADGDADMNAVPADGVEAEDVVGDRTQDVSVDGEDDIPPAPLWAMRIRMHSLRRLEPGEEGRIRRRLGDDDDALYFIDDGPDHCMVGRRVGHAPDGCVYCLVARISLDRYTDLVDGDVDRTEAFADARDISLCGVFEAEEAGSNVLLVQHYRRPRDVPEDYLPSSPYIEFTDNPDEED